MAVLLPYLGWVLVDFIWNELKRDGLVCSTRKEAAEEQGGLVYSALEDMCLMNEAPGDDSWEQLSWLQRSRNLVPKYPLGQLVWVRDEPSVAWIRGEVQAHDNAGLPLVRPVIGRMRKYDCKLTDNFELAGGFVHSLAGSTPLSTGVKKSVKIFACGSTLRRRHQALR